MKFFVALALLVFIGLAKSQNPLGSCNKGKAYILSPLNSRVERPVSMVGYPEPFTCSMKESQIASTGAASVYGGANRNLRWYIGEVANRSSSDPIIAHFNANKLVWCRSDFETTADASVGYGLLYNSPGSLYALFSSRGFDVGSGSADQRRYSTNGWQPRYGSVRAGSRQFHQGSSKVSILAKLNPLTGDVMASTYLTSRDLFGTVGELVVKGLKHSRATRNSAETITVVAQTSAAPLRPNLTRMKCTTNAPYHYEITLDSGLNKVIATSSPTCA